MSLQEHAAAHRAMVTFLTVVWLPALSIVVISPSLATVVASTVAAVAIALAASDPAVRAQLRRTFAAVVAALRGVWLRPDPASPFAAKRHCEPVPLRSLIRVRSAVEPRAPTPVVVLAI